MKNNITRIIKFTIAASLSIVIHAAILFNFTPENSSAKTAVPEFTEKKRPNQNKKTQPLRLAINDPKLKKNNGSPATKPKASSAPKTDLTDRKPEKSKPTVNIDSNKLSAAVANNKTDSTSKEQKSEYKQVLKKLEQKENGIVYSRMTQSQYKLMLQQNRIGKFKGAPTPRLDIVFNNTEQILSVHHYFGMKVVALDPNSPEKVVELTGIGTNEVDFQLIPTFNWKSYSNRIFPRTSPYFTNYLKELSRFNLINSNNIKLVSVTPNSPDAYFRYKQLQVIKSNGLDKNNVTSTIGRFRKTSFGSWILVIEKAALTSGEIISMQDFELTAITQ